MQTAEAAKIVDAEIAKLHCGYDGQDRDELIAALASGAPAIFNTGGYHNQAAGLFIAVGYDTFDRYPDPAMRERLAEAAAKACKPLNEAGKRAIEELRARYAAPLSMAAE